MEQRSLKVVNTDKTFFSKITNTLTKILIPTRVGINGILISVKRNALLKAYESYKLNINTEDETRKEFLQKKYEDSYALYLESIDKLVMDSIYKKVKNNTASNFERNALAKYYTVTHLKDNNYLEYKYRKQKYLIDLDYETVLEKDKLQERYNEFYTEKMDVIYKGILKNYSVQLADNLSNNNDRLTVYNNIYNTVEEYVTTILPIKKRIDVKNNYDTISEECEELEKFSVGKLDDIDYIEKNMLLIGISRTLFTHSLPLIVAEQCYIKLLKETRNKLKEMVNTKKEKRVYTLLLKLIEEYNIKLLSSKIYWDNQAIRADYKIFWNKYINIEKLEEKQFKKQKEILFLKYDLKLLNKSKKDYSKITQIYKNKLVELGAMRQFKDDAITTKTKYTSKMKIKSKLK